VKLNGSALRLLDQGLFSLGNIAVIALISHSASSAVAGAIIVLYVAYPIATALVQGYIVDFHLVFADPKHPYSANQAWRGALIAGLPIAVLVPVLLLLSGGGTAHRGTVIAATILFASIPGLTAQYSGRAFCLSTGQLGKAIASDGGWLVGQAVLYVVGRSAGLSPTTAAVLSWCVAGNLCGLIFAFGRRLSAQGPPPTAKIVRTRINFASELTLGQAHAQINLVLVGALVGLAPLAGYRVAQVVLGPLLTALAALRHFLVPKYASIYRESGHPAPVIRAATLHAALVAAALQGAALLIWALPPSLGASIFGDTWHRARPLLPLVGLDGALAGAGIMYAVALRALVMATGGLVVRLLISVLSILLVLGACLVYGTAMSVAWAGAISSLFGIVLYVGITRQTLARSRRETVTVAEPVTREHAAYPLVAAGAAPRPWKRVANG
jgi:hypothetical protein